MRLRAVRPLVVLAAGVAVALLGGCGGSSNTPASAGATGGPASASAGVSASARPSASGSGQPAGGSGGGGGQTGGGSGSGGSGGGGTGGKPAGGTGAKPALQACQVITNAQATAALGAPGSLVVATNASDTCVYQTADTKSSVEVDLQSVPFSADIPNGMMGLLSPTQAKRVPGLGDAAIIFDSAPGETQFYLWKDGLFVTIIVTKTAGSNAAANSLGHQAAVVV